MSFTVFLGNLPAWVTADDIKGWLSAENLVADAIKVIRNPETQESKGFAFIDAPNAEEMNSIIRRFDRAPLEDRLLRANPAQPPKPKSQTTPSPGGRPAYGQQGQYGGQHSQPAAHHSQTAQPAQQGQPAGAQASATANAGTANVATTNTAAAAAAAERQQRRPKKTGGPRRESDGPQSAFAEELARAL